LGGRRWSGLKEEVMEFLVKLDITVPEGTLESEVTQRASA
jgi:hypothetical protein